MKVDRISVKIIEMVRRAKQVRAKTPAGTDFVATLNPNYKWVKTSGIISPDKWGNLRRASGRLGAFRERPVRS